MPVSHSVSATMTSISLSWGPVECLLRNGRISGYRVTSNSRYDSTTQDLVGDSNRVLNFTALIPNTLYEFTVAALGEGGMPGPERLLNITTAPAEGKQV